MAIPTITSVSPSAGPSGGGFVVVITGTGFKVPALDWAIPSPSVVPTVSVKIGGVSCTVVKVRSSTSLEVQAPRYAAQPTKAVFSALSVRVANLQADGVSEVAAENATRSTCFTYYRWGLGAPRKDPPMVQVLEAILIHFMSEVVKDVSVQAHGDYGLEGEEITVIAKVPSMGVRLSMPPDIEWRQWDNDDEEVSTLDGRVAVYRNRDTRMLVLDLTLCGETPAEALALEQGVQDFVNGYPELELNSDPDLYPGEQDLIPLEVSQPSRQASNPSNQDLAVFTMQIRARGIPCLSDLPYESVPLMAEFILSQLRLETGTHEDSLI